MDRQCSSCGGFCKKSGCERENVQPEPEPVAWVSSLDSAQPHCVTDLKYCTVLQHERGEHLKYTPLYKDPTPCKTCEALARTVMLDQTSHDTKKEWVGLTNDEAADFVLFHAVVDEECIRAIETKLKEKNFGPYTAFE